MARKSSQHRCEPPTNPNGSPTQDYGTAWSCPQCSKRWYVGEACDRCTDSQGGGLSHDGECVFGWWVWRPTGTAAWYRIEHWINWRRRRNPVD